MVSSWNGCWIAPSSSSKSSIHAPKTSYYAPEPRKEKSHLPNTYYCTAYDLAALIPPPASSWHQASPYSLHQQAIPHKRKATDLADSTREKGIHSNCSHSYVDTKRKKQVKPTSKLFGLKRFGAAQTRKRKLLNLRHWAISLLVRWKSKWKASQQTNPGARRHSERGKLNWKGEVRVLY